MALLVRVLFWGIEMPPIIDVKKPFKVAVDSGNRVIEIEPGEHDVDDRIAEIAVNQLEVAELVQPDNPPEPEPEPKPTKPKPRARGKANDSIPDTGTGEA